MSGSLGATLASLVREGVADRLFTAACYEVHWRGRRVTAGCVGHLTARSRTEATRTTLFDLASLTKPLATALSAMKAAQAGELLLDAPLIDLLVSLSAHLSTSDSDPPLRSHRRLRQATVRQLLSHSSGLAPWAPLYKLGLSRRQFLGKILTDPPTADPGTKHQYSCLGYILLGEIVGAALRQPLGEFAREQLFHPLGLKDTGFRPRAADRSRAAATEYCPWRGYRARGQVHDENAFSLGGMAGNAGLFSTAADLSRLFRALLARKSPFDLTNSLYATYIGNQLKSIGAHASCGWCTYDGDSLTGARGFSPASFGHTGFTGTSVIVDPDNDGFAFLLTNRVYYGREFQQYGALRRTFYDRVGEGVRSRPR